MASPAPQPVPPAPATLPSGDRNVGQWALVAREFRRRRLAVVAFWLIVVLVTVSVFAPFLANDRPLVYKGYNRFDYTESARTIRALLGELSELSKNADDSAAEGLRREESTAATLRAIRGHLQAMAANVDETSAAKLESFGDRVAEAIEAEDRPGRLQELRVELRRDFEARHATFVTSWHSPVAVSLNAYDLAFITATLLFLASPLWRRVVRRFLARGRPALATRISVAVYVLSPLLIGLAWWMAVPERVDRTRYKQGVFATNTDDLGRASVVYENVVWPPVPFGLDEDDLDHKLAPPPFWKDAGDPKPSVFDRTVSSNGLPLQPLHWMGTDGIGRDILCRMIWGGRVSLAVGLVAVSIYVTLGVIIGAAAGYFRGLPDMIISRIIEVVICFPSFFLILTIVAFIGPSIFNIMVVIGLTGWTGVARLVRGEFLRLGEQEFVLAGRALGYTAPRLIFRHVLPNAMAPVLVAATFGIAGAILTESALSFLGFGITVPKPSWGGILADGRDTIFSAPWLIYFPGLAIFITITAYNLIGEAFRDAADPRLRESGRR